MSAGSISLDEGNGQAGTFRADPADELFTGVAAGDQVEVTYHEAAGGPVADAVDDQSWVS